MSQYIGVDFGSMALKVAAVDTIGNDAQVVALDHDRPFLPAAVEISGPQWSDWRCGSEAFQLRRNSVHVVAHGFRDRVMSPESQLTFGGQSVDGMEVTLAVLADLGGRIQAGVRDPAAVALSVPDAWPPVCWSLPIALKSAGWAPVGLVREWAAILSSGDLPVDDECIVLSLGTGAARTLCVSKDGFWRAAHSESIPRLSGAALHDRLVAEITEEIIQTTRHNPREDAEADQALHTAIGDAVAQLETCDATAYNFQLFQQQVSRTLSRSQIAMAGACFRDLLTQGVERLMACRGDQNGSGCPVIAWGQLSKLLPVEEWLSSVAGDCPLTLVGIDAVARGTAQVCRRLCEGDLGSMASRFPRVCATTGSIEVARGGSATGAPPLVDCLPAESSEPAPAQRKPGTATTAEAQLTMSNEANSPIDVVIRAPEFLLGRSPHADWTFSSDEFPTVSFDHAVIRFESGSFVLSDLDSSNGTFVNGERIDVACVLQNDDEIRLGLRGPRLHFQPME